MALDWSWIGFGPVWDQYLIGWDQFGLVSENTGQVLDRFGTGCGAVPDECWANAELVAGMDLK